VLLVGKKGGASSCAEGVLEVILPMEETSGHMERLKISWSLFED
jgi:hypothetical protein